MHGTPSLKANKKLLKFLNPYNNKIKELSYRGNGWPGNASILLENGKYNYTSYENSWGNYLGRDLQDICRFCWEGTGEAADISCGDGWYIENNKPVFAENEGRNVILARTLKRKAIIRKNENG